MGLSETHDYLRMDALALMYNNPTCLECYSSGAVTGSALSPGRYLLAANVDCYFRKGDSTLAVGDVAVDESTPDTSMPLFAGTYLPTTITGNDDDYLACKTTGASGIFWIMKCALNTD